MKERTRRRARLITLSASTIILLLSLVKVSCNFTAADSEKGGKVRHPANRFCPTGHFECESDSSLCVPQSSICNGKEDCPDGSDEVECENVHDKAFWDNFFRKRPGADVAKNDTCKYSMKLGPSCVCSGEKLFCHNLPRAKVEATLLLIPKKVEFLDLSGSELDVDFTGESTRFQELHTLILSSTGQLKMEAGQFAGFHKLEILHLTGNKLESIPSLAFSKNGKLKRLFLGHNRISSLSSDSFLGLTELEELDLRNNLLPSLEHPFFSPLPNLKILHLSFNLLETLTPASFLGLGKLELLSLSKNRIRHLAPQTFSSLQSLLYLYLSHNQLDSLNEVFCNLTSLLNLNLNDNGIKEIAPSSFSCLGSLRSLHLEQNAFGELEDEIFANLTELQHIYFDHFWMCAWALHVRSCEPKGDGISSVENLLDNLILRIFVWIMSLIGIVGNSFVILSRLLFREKNKVHSFYIKNLAFADLLMGLFLLSVAVHDVQFRGQFLARQHAWRHSWLCQWSGLLSTLSSESSVLVLSIITLDRYLSIVKPFIERRSAMGSAIFVISLLWLFSFFLSYAPLSNLFTGYFQSKFYTSNGLCLPLNIHNPFDPGWEYSFFLFVLINSVAFAFICYAYGKMLLIIKSSTTSVRSTQQKQDGMLAARFGLVVVTDFLCWAPVIVAKMLAISGLKIPPGFYAWLAVFVLPVNSALNPVIYTLTTKLFKQQVSHLTIGVRKRLGMATDDSTTSSLYYRNRMSRTLNTSLSSSMMHSTKANGPVPLPGPGRRIQEVQSRNRNRATISAINSVIASSTGIQLPADQQGSFPLERLDEAVEAWADGEGGVNPVSELSLKPQEQETTT